MGAGRSIAVQNFNEQACILGLGAFYTGMTRFGLSAFGAIAVFGVAGRRHDVADPALAPQQLRAAPRRGRAPAGDRAAATSTERRRPCGARRRAWPALALVFNAFVWGVSWWPFRQLQAHGLHPLWATALIYLLASLVIAVAAAARAGRGAARPPALWLLVAGGRA